MRWRILFFTFVQRLRELGWSGVAMSRRVLLWIVGPQRNKS
jgi:hypothetical protein